MNNKLKSVVLVLLVVFVSVGPFTKVKADISQLNTNDNYVTAKLTMTSPNNNTAYTDGMPLNLTIEWSTNVIISWMKIQISYSIDNGSKIPINGENSIFNNGSSIATDTTHSYELVDISNLTNRAHELTVFADGTYLLNEDFVYAYHSSSAPIYFYVNYLPTSSTPIALTPNPSPSPTPTLTELPLLAVLPLVLSMFSIALILKRRKTPKKVSKIF